ncbi:hypothetical protein PACTADRAFT_49108, partial [Pachysolen tannophilus NRRL Y-2460]
MFLKICDLAPGYLTADSSNNSGRVSSALTNSDNINTPNEGRTSGSSTSPEIPTKPTSLSNSENLSSTSAYSPYGLSNNYSSGYGSSPYGGGYGGGYGSYGSRYGMGGGYGSLGGFGGYGSSMYGGMGTGGYGGLYGGGMYGGGAGAGMANNNSFSQSTEATFQLIESIIGAVGGFAQMLESTYMATHNSFFTMISVAEQFSHLKNALGSLLGIFALVNWLKKMLGKVNGDKNYLKITPGEFKKFQDKQNLLKDTKVSSNRISLKPLLVFIAAIFGFPYLLKKLIHQLSLIQQQQQQQQQRQQGYRAQMDSSSTSSLPGSTIDPIKLEFARALYDFNPENKQIELELKKKDLVAILSKV